MATKKITYKLKAQKRTIVGRKVKKLRGEGVLPANVYGKKVKSQAVRLDLKDFLPVYQEAGETGLVELTLKGETKARPVLIHNVHLDPVTDQPLHADFYQVSLKEKVTTEIPVELVGESPAVKEKVGILVQQLSEIEVEALPTELPEKFTVDIGQLKKVDDAITVGDLKAPQGVEILVDKSEVLAQISPLAKEEEAPPPPESVEGEAQGAEGEETKTETEKPTEDQAEVKGADVKKETPEKPESNQPAKEEAAKK